MTIFLLTNATEIVYHLLSLTALVSFIFGVLQVVTDVLVDAQCSGVDGQAVLRSESNVTEI